MYSYTILNDNQFEVNGPGYHSIFTGDEAKAQEVIASLENPFVPTPETMPGQPEIKIVIDKPIITADGSDTATISITLERDGQPVSDSDGTKYYIPILKIDGTQHSLATLILLDGRGTMEFKTTIPSIYTVKLDMMRPKPTAKLQDNPEIIAE